MLVTYRRAMLWLLALSVFALTLLAFWSGISGGFLLDDFHNIVENPHLHLTELTAAAMWKAANGYSGGTRQLAMLSFALNYHWAGLNPMAYKATGLTIHAINTVLVYLLAVRIFSLSTVIGRRHVPWAAAGAALIWAVHPLQVSSALYIVQRMEILSVSFLLVSLILYLRARTAQIVNGSTHMVVWVGVAISWGLAFLCKESAVLLPLFTLALELTLLRFKSASSAQQRFWRWSYSIAIAFALLTFAVWVLPHYYSADAYFGRDFNTKERVLTQFRVLVLYLKQIILPLPSSMTFYYDNLANSSGWLTPISTLISALFLMSLLGLALLWRTRYPLFSLGVLLFFSAHFLTSNVIPLEQVFEHRNYFAIFGVLLVAAEIIARLPAQEDVTAKYVGVAILAIGIGLIGAIRAATWGNTLLLATDMVDHNPDSARAGMDLGVAYYEMSDGNPDSPFFHFAASQFERVVLMRNASSQAYVNLILMDAAGGLPPDSTDVDELWHAYLQHLRSAHLGVENRLPIWSLLGQRQKGKPINDAYLQDALDIIFEREQQPDYRYANAADYYLNTVGDSLKAEKYYREAIKLAAENQHAALIGTIIGDLLETGHEDLARKLVKIEG